MYIHIYIYTHIYIRLIKGALRISELSQSHNPFPKLPEPNGLVFTFGVWVVLWNAMWEFPKISGYLILGSL